MSGPVIRRSVLPPSLPISSDLCATSDLSVLMGQCAARLVKLVDNFTSFRPSAANFPLAWGPRAWQCAGNEQSTVLWTGFLGN